MLIYDILVIGQNSKFLLLMKGESSLAHIICEKECFEKNACAYSLDKCPFPKCPDDHDCLSCKNHCPCCTGADENLCNQCSEENCDNRTAVYDPSLISPKEE